MTTVFSIGYQGKSARAIAERLAVLRVSALVDVRDRAWSHRPEFRKTALQNVLAEHGVGYIHCREAGNPYRPTKDQPRSLEECVSLYSEHLRQNPAAVEAVRALVESGPVALFCYEHLHTDCHRGVLLDAMADVMPELRHEALE